MATLSAEQIRSTKSQFPKPQAVEVPEWGGTVYVKRLTASERDQFEQLVGENRDNKTFSARGALLVYVLCDEAGKRLFDWGTEGLIGELDGVAVDRVFRVAARINGMAGDAVEQAEKN